MTLEELKDKYGDEKVLCIASKRINENVDNVFEMCKLYGVMRLRYKIETDTTIKQIIPYVVVKYKDKILTTKRLQGDERLVGQYSIGTGGHVNPVDLSIKDSIDIYQTILNCIQRELSEETNLDNFRPYSLQYVKCFIDDSADVSRVHVCILYTYDLTKEEYDNFSIRETDKLEGEFLIPNEFTEDKIATLEGWSKIAYTILNENHSEEPKTERKTRSRRKRVTQE